MLRTKKLIGHAFVKLVDKMAYSHQNQKRGLENATLDPHTLLVGTFWHFAGVSSAVSFTQ